MALLDINVALGRFAKDRFGFDTPADMRSEMQRLRISEALVCHALALEGDIELGNRRLSDCLHGEPDLYPCWVMAPSVLGDLPEPSAWVAAAVAAGVRAVRAVPRHSLYSLASWCVDPLLAALEKAELPLLIDFGPRHWSEKTIPWTDIEAVCSRHPSLNVVVLGATVSDTRDAVPLLHSLPNLYLELHAFNPADGLPLLARDGLASQLIFGTGLPQRAAECVVEQTLRSGLAAADLNAIAAGNARRLLRLPARVPPPFLGAGDDPTAHTVGAVIDVHAHAGAWERTVTTVRNPDDAVRSMHRCGIHKMILSSFAAIHGEVRTGNRQTAEWTAAYPDFLYAYAVVHPHYPAEIENELEQCFEQSTNFVGIKFHCGLHGAQLQHNGYIPALEYADAHQLPILVHGGGQDDWETIAGRYPKAAFIMAHACSWDGFDPAGRRLYQPARDLENLFVDVAGSAAHHDALYALIDLVGSDKVLFGSDFPMFDLSFALGRIARSRLNPVEKVRICGGNALRIFRSVQ